MNKHSRKKSRAIGGKTSPAKSAPKRKPASGKTFVAGSAENQVAKVLSHAEKLHDRADEVHTKADELHHSIREMRHVVRHPGVSSNLNIEASAIVTDEKRVGKGVPFSIVGIGASAGGYEAFTEFLMHLPKDLGMAIVFVQHLDPKHKSKLAELLAHTAKQPVVEAQSDMEVRPDHIYVMPENVTLTIQDDRLCLSPRREHEAPPMPIDAFFRSLAENQQNRAIAVVLSGTGTDGSLGLEAVKGEGGITFAQDEGSSKYFGMPDSAIRSGSVDFILSPSEIAKELVRIAAHPLVGRFRKQRTTPDADGGEADKLTSESPAELNTLFSLLRLRKGVDFSLYKQTTIKRRIIRRMVLHKVETLGDYLGFIQNSPAELHGLFNDLLINVTNFFRDAAAFQTLKKRVFPRVIKTHTDDSPLRFWSCGCATGEEAYSLAISLIESFEQDRIHRQVQIFATDVGDGSIEKARAGIYPEAILQDVSSERLRRFFTKLNGHYQVHKSIRDMCIFARQNVLLDPPFSNLDLITCRNVLIYFGPLLQRKIIPLFHYALRPTGFLLLGNSETIGQAGDHFNLIDKKHKIYVKKENYHRPDFEGIHKAQELEAQRARRPAEKDFESDKRQDFQAQVDNILLHEFSPAAVVVNSEFEVIHFRGGTGDFLEHAPGSASLNLLKMARDGLTMPLRLLLNKAAKQDLPVKQSGIELRQNGRDSVVTIEVRPLKLGIGAERFFLIIFRESNAGAVGPSRAKGEGQAKMARQRGEEVARLEQELSSTKVSLQSIIEEQDATNEELQSANEEIQSSNEELQSTNEELETAKEELQSTNEELTTLNEELQTRNGELGQVNNDLANLLSSVNVPILMVGTDLTIRRFNPMAEKVFSIIPADVGRWLADINRNIFLPELEEIVSRVIEDLSTVEREVQDREDRWWMLRVRPYRTRENKIEGAVIVLMDIDELRRALDVTLGMVKQPLLILGADMIVRNVNQAFLDTFGLVLKEIEAKPLFEVSGGPFDIPNLRLLIEDILPRNKRVMDYDIEIRLPRLGVRKIRLNASRFFEEGHGIPTILMAAEDVTGK